MTQDQIDGYIRTLCTILSTVSGGAAGVYANQISTLQTVLLGVASLAFFAYSVCGSWKAHSTMGIILSAAAVPDTKIVTQPAIAAVTPSNVTSSASTKVVGQ